MLPIEKLIRCVCAEHANVYALTLFACCRQKFNPDLCKCIERGMIDTELENFKNLNYLEER